MDVHLGGEGAVVGALDGDSGGHHHVGGSQGWQLVVAHVDPLDAVGGMAAAFDISGGMGDVILGRVNLLILDVVDGQRGANHGIHNNGERAAGLLQPFKGRGIDQGDAVAGIVYLHLHVVGAFALGVDEKGRGEDENGFVLRRALGTEEEGTVRLQEGGQARGLDLEGEDRRGIRPRFQADGFLELVGMERIGDIYLRKDVGKVKGGIHLGGMGQLPVAEGGARGAGGEIALQAVAEPVAPMG